MINILSGVIKGDIPTKDECVKLSLEYWNDLSKKPYNFIILEK